MKWITLSRCLSAFIPDSLGEANKSYLFACLITFCLTADSTYNKLFYSGFRVLDIALTSIWMDQSSSHYTNQRVQQCLGDSWLPCLIWQGTFPNLRDSEALWLCSLVLTTDIITLCLRCKMLTSANIASWHQEKVYLYFVCFETTQKFHGCNK